ncbi:MAG: TetR/AcrR family transcriptional regulator [Coriobacteriales bacterium]|jgi:AcrR family transcriptional regulator|nr:TetR/AcrR family transcriptional regulator [Coriobacteriales bacterium]
MVDVKMNPPKDYTAKLRFVSALDALLQERSFDDVTVKMIAEQAGLTRPTFYRYFTDKYAVIQWHSDIIAKRVSSKSGAA